MWCPIIPPGFNKNAPIGLLHAQVSGCRWGNGNKGSVFIAKIPQSRLDTELAEVTGREWAPKMNLYSQKKKPFLVLPVACGYGLKFMSFHGSVPPRNRQNRLEIPNETIFHNSIAIIRNPRAAEFAVLSPILNHPLALLGAHCVSQHSSP